MKLYNICHSRTGDKGNISTISLIPYDEKNYDIIKNNVTEELVFNHFKDIGTTQVKRYEIPSMKALNFVLFNTLGGGVTSSLAIDTHGKSLSGLMLEIEI